MNTQSEYQRKYLAKRRKDALVYLGNRCAKCPSTRSLEFDHIDPTSKSIEISNAIAKHYSWIRLVEELDKCQLLCKPCHKAKTSNEGSAKRTHGKSHLAIRCKCTCIICTEFRFMYNAKRRQARHATLK